ncbi:hypothetical protein [Dyadobacter sp. CY327]|nr:hypothetical protein [Dyadobacter sp. CY327]
MAEIDGKIVDALARVSQAFRVLLRNELALKSAGFAWAITASC